MSVKIFYFYNVVTDGVHYGLTTSVVVGSAPPSGFMTEFTLTKEFVTTYTDHSGTPRRRREDWNWDEFGILKFVHLLELLKFLQSLQCKDRNNDSNVIYVRYFIFEYIFFIYHVMAADGCVRFWWGPRPHHGWWRLTDISSYCILNISKFSFRPAALSCDKWIH